MHTFSDLKTSMNTTTRSHLTITDFSHKNHFEIHFFTSCRSFLHTFTSKPSSPQYSGGFPSRTHRSKRYPFDTIFNAPSQLSKAHGRLRPYVDIFCPPARVVCYFSMRTSHKTTTAASFELVICGRFQYRPVEVSYKTVWFSSLNSS